MTNEVPYKHPETGKERFFPDGLGEKLGYERVAGFVPPELEGKSAQPSGKVVSDEDAPTLTLALNQLSEKVDADTKISNPSKVAIKKHIAELIDALPELAAQSAPAADPASESTTNPQESDLPGKTPGLNPPAE